MFPLGSTGKYVAMASLYNWAEGGYYTNEWFLGTIKDSKTFVLEDRGLLDFGQYYAARTGSEDQSPTGRRVLFSATGWHNPPGERSFLRHLLFQLLKTERLPRQGRDKHRENSNDGPFSPRNGTLQHPSPSHPEGYGPRRQGSGDLLADS